jgi:hypothetical protein
MRRIEAMGLVVILVVVLLLFQFIGPIIYNIDTSLVKLLLG